MVKNKGKEIKEIVKIEKDGKEVTKEFSGKIKEEHASKKQIKKQRKQLRNILGILSIFVILFLVLFIINYKSTHFKYEDLKFKVVKEGSIIFYQVPMITQYQGSKLIYNFYLRTNPNKLKEIPFEGEIELKNNIVLNVTTKNLYCDGDWQIAIGNMILLDIFNINVVKDENLTCGMGTDYIYMNIHEGNESKIVQSGPACYDLYVSNCEVLPVTERFMVETFLKINEFVEDYSWT